MKALLDGKPAEAISLADSSVLRGDGCFEAIRSYQGRLFALGWHLDRLELSAKSLGIAVPARADLETWCARMAEHGDGVVRVLVTRGSALPGDRSPPACVVVFHELPSTKASIELFPVRAPWHAAGRWSELAGAKTLSYAPNLAAQRSAQDAGFDDALLTSWDGTVLECPTAAVAWVVDGVIETPTLDLYVLASITRRTMLGLADGRFAVVEGTFPLERLDSAEEVFVMSTVREITPVVAVGSLRFEPGPVTDALGRSFRSAVEAGWGR